MSDNTDFFSVTNALISTTKQTLCNGGIGLSSSMRTKRNIDVMVLLKREILNKNLLGLTLVLMYIQGSAVRDSIYNDYEKDNVELLRAALQIEPNLKTDNDIETYKIMQILINDSIANLIEQSHNIDSLVSLVNNQIESAQGNSDSD